MNDTGIEFESNFQQALRASERSTVRDTIALAVVFFLAGAAASALLQAVL